MNARSQAQRALEEAFREFLLSLPPGLHEGVARTPERAAKALIEMTSGYDVEATALFTDFDAGSYDQLIAECNIPFTSLCEHHILGFSGTAHVVYQPNSRIIGASKIARAVDVFAHRLQVQERLTEEIADAVNVGAGAQGVLVQIEAEHSCMACRGIRKPGVVFVTSAIRGSLMEQTKRSEALAMIRLAKR